VLTAIETGFVVEFFYRIETNYGPVTDDQWNHEATFDTREEADTFVAKSIAEGVPSTLIRIVRSN
jgi:hypothetical protein